HPKDPVPGRLLRLPDGRRRVRPERPRAFGRDLDGDRPRVLGPGRLPPRGTEGRLRPRGNDAPRCAAGRPHERVEGRRGLPEVRDLGAPPPPVRDQPEVSRAVPRPRYGRDRNGRGRPGRSARGRGPSVLRRGAVPPRVPVTPRGAASSLPRPG